MQLTAACDGLGLKVKADFGRLDDQYKPGAETPVEQGTGDYQVCYALSQNNGIPDGTYPVIVTVYDQVGLKSTREVKLILDNQGPVVSEIILKDPDDILAKDDQIQVKLKDSTSVLAQAEYFVDVVREPGRGISLQPEKGPFMALTGTAGASFAIKDVQSLFLG